MSRPPEQSARLLVTVPCGQLKIWDKYPEAGPTAAADAYIGPPSRWIGDTLSWLAATGWSPSTAFCGLPMSSQVRTTPRANVGPRTAIGVAALREQVEQMSLDRYGEVIGLGGKEYRDAIQAAFEGTRVRLSFPFTGLPIGKALGGTKRATLP